MLMHLKAHKNYLLVEQAHFYFYTKHTIPWNCHNFEICRYFFKHFYQNILSIKENCKETQIINTTSLILNILQCFKNIFLAQGLYIELTYWVNGIRPENRLSFWTCLDNNFSAHKQYISLNCCCCCCCFPKITFTMKMRLIESVAEWSNSIIIF